MPDNSAESSLVYFRLGAAFGWRCLALRGKGRCVGAGRRCLPRWGKGALGGRAPGFGGLEGWRRAGSFHAQDSPFWARGVGGGGRRFFPSGLLSRPAGLRRAPPAPAQGTCPLRIPLAAAQRPVPCNASRAAPAREPPGVYSCFRPNWNATKRACPLLVGQARVAHPRQLWLPAPPATKAAMRSTAF